MRTSERTVYEHLVSLGMGPVVQEPDGNIPPDFVIDGRVAVEARRLNPHEMVGTTHRGLEETSIRLQAAVSRILSEYVG